MSYHSDIGAVFNLTQLTTEIAAYLCVLIQQRVLTNQALSVM